MRKYADQKQCLIVNKAIDDFIKAVDKQCGYYAGECKNLTRDDLLKIAKELKDNG